MPIEQKLVRITDPADPNRCQGIDNSGQCWYMKQDGSEYCHRHGGNQGHAQDKAAALRNYRLGKFQARVNQFADSSGVKSLREEIGILRMLLESTVLKIKEDTDLLLFAPRIADMVMKIDKVVNSCQKLETSTGLLLDKAAALTLASQMVTIIGKYVKDPDSVDGIANEIGLLILGEKRAESE